MTDTHKRTVYFDSINQTSVWYAAKYAFQGWQVKYFERSPAGAMTSKALRFLSRGRIAFSHVDVQIGEFKGLYFEATKIGLAFTEEWFTASDSYLTRQSLNSLGQEERATAYLKKAMSLRSRKLVSHVEVFHRLKNISDKDAILCVRKIPGINHLLNVYQNLTGKQCEVRTYPSPFPRLGLIFKLARYYRYILGLIVQRGVTLTHERESYLIAKAAMWPIGSRPSDDFLVGGEEIFPSDLLLYYGSRSQKSRVIEAVEAARGAGYSPVAWDRVPVSLGWIFRPDVVRRYFFQPMWQTAEALLFGKVGYSFNVVSMMLDLRRAKIGWDIFFEKYNVSALFDPGVLENQVAVTMSADDYGTLAFKPQTSEILDDTNENHQYLTHHYHFTWGQGVTDLWKDRWRVDSAVPVGYIWGEYHQSGLLRREATREIYGVTGRKRLVVVFDTSANNANFVSPDALRRFYKAVASFARSLEDGVVVVKPKDASSPPPDFDVLEDALLSCKRLVWEDFMKANTNDLIAAADLVIAMAHSSTFIEALVCGVPAIAYDETGRDWTGVLPHNEQFVFQNGADLCEAAAHILECGVEPKTWRDVQERIRWNYGEPDGLAVSRMRRDLLEACGVVRNVDIRRDLTLSKSGV